MERSVTTLDEALQYLDELEHQHLDLLKRMMAAYESTLYPLDLFVTGALNRSMVQTRGFRILLGEQNLTCATPLVRMQLDNALRLYAAYIAPNPHDFAHKIMQGTRVSKLCDESGKKMNDAHLVAEVSKDFPWVKGLYEEASGFVHLSEKHLLRTMTFDNKDNRQINLRIAPIDDDIPEEVYINATQVFLSSTKLFFYYVEVWIRKKSNPDLVEQQEEPNPEERK